MFSEVYKIDDHLSVELSGIGSNIPYKIYGHKDPIISCDKENLLKECQGGDCKIELKSKLKLPYYFTLEFENGIKLLSGFRILPFKGMYNFRDMGGYENMEGKRLKWGLLFRGDQLYNMEEASFCEFHDLNIRSIVDFRNAFEYTSNPNLVATKYGIEEYHFVPEGGAAALAGDLATYQSKLEHKHDISEIRKELDKDPDLKGKSMILQQENFTKDPSSIKAFGDTLHLLARNDSYPLYFHCRGGKDRTGYLAMLLMGCLDFDEKTIIYDYMLTKRARAKKNALYLEKFRKMAQGDEEVAQVLLSYFDTKEEYLQAAINAIKQKHSSIKDYCIDVLGIFKEEIEQLKINYLE